MRFVTLLIFVTAASALMAQTPRPNDAPAGNAANGKKIYADYGCYQCHGYEGQGGGAGARIAPRPMQFQAFSRYVRQPSGQMPPYTAKSLTDREMADIYAFLLTIPEPKPVSSIPQLRD